MTPEVRRLVLAVLAYDRALARETRRHGKAGNLSDVPAGGVTQVYVSAEELDACYLDMLRALVPFLIESGASIPKDWPPEVKQ
jgi:hypothetical protein